MEKVDLINILADALKPIGFKKKGNYWVVNGEEINKLVNLQRSQYSNTYYINYGFIVNAIPLDNPMSHTYSRVETGDNLMETDLLNLDNSIPHYDRKIRLKEIILEQIVSKMQKINSETDVLNYMKSLPTLNVIPLAVKKYFNLEP
ncbi:MAG: hypothetical protein JWR50_2413 [Mucilaginibacter sp.]|nr:hypothetical protein [Mucilaginibacter sp.]